MTKEINYAEVRVLVGRGDDGKTWVVDTADEDWGSENFVDWLADMPPRKLLVRVPIQHNKPVIIILPENPSDPVSVEVSV